MKKKVHLVLGSGGARGLAHIGVIEELEKNGYEIIEVVGCSMGAVIGGVYASGHMEEYKNWMLSMSKRTVFDLMDFTLTKLGFMKGEKVFSKMNDITGSIKIEDFPIPFTAVAVNMLDATEVYFNKGDLYKALRASVSIPGVFIPVIEDEMILVDGGVMNPLPLNLIKKQDDAIVIAVNLNAEPILRFEFESKEKERESLEIIKWFTNIIPDSLWDTFNRDHEPKELEPLKKENPFTLRNLMETSYAYTTKRLTELIIEKYTPDILINVPRNVSSTFDFHRTKEISELGRLLMEKELEKFQKKELEI